MANLWQMTDYGCEVRPLSATASSADPGLMALTDDALPGVQIVRFRDGSRMSHVLIAGGDMPVSINGMGIVGGLGVLGHKDELMIGPVRMFFSAAARPVIEVYQHDDSSRLPRCPICRGEIHTGQTIVRCPGCTRIYHQLEAVGDTPAKPCWTYAPTCRFCEHSTSLSDESLWRPAVDLA